MTLSISPRARAGLALCGGLLLAACGGGSPSGDPWEQRTAMSDPLAAQCYAPRSGNQPYPDEQASLRDEQDWLRTYMGEIYLWYEEIPSSDPAQYTVVSTGSWAQAMTSYFYSLLTPARTASGNYKDRFSFTYPTDQWRALSQSGVSVGYGAQFAILASTSPREVVVAYTDPGTPAAARGLRRGARVLAIDGVDMTNGGDTDTLNAGLYPSSAGETHSFKVQDLGASTPRTVSLTAAAVTATPVHTVRTIATSSGPVGYILFNDHIATAEGQLYDAVNALLDAGLSDLVLDMRYNGGGYLDIAAELGYMIAGAPATSGRRFERLRFNDKHPFNGVDGTDTPFHDESQGFDPVLAPGTPLPALDLPRVFVLVGPGTCSASEALINGLRGVDVQVVLIGDTSCGKPYGFYAQDNCGLSYFAIEFEGVNDQGQGGYSDGIAADCAVEDDFEHALGDAGEALLAAALNWRQTGSCPADAAFKRGGEPLRLLRPPVRENAYRRPPG